MIQKRKIVKSQFVSSHKPYMALRPDRFSDNGDWHTLGKRYTIKGIHNLVQGDTFDFEVSSEVREDLATYRRKRREQETQYGYR